MSMQRRCIATSLLCVLALFAAARAQAAQAVGTVVNLSGALLAKKDDGTIKILAQKSEVEQGDTLISEKNSYARIRFIDNGEITLQPNTRLKIDRYSYEADKPEHDSAIFNLVKGGLRSITGLLGKRNHDRFGMHTPTATIGIRGTVFIAEYVPPEPPAQPAVAWYGASSVAMAPEFLTSQYATRTDAPYRVLPAAVTQRLQLAQNVPTPGGGRAPGLYVQVLDGMINLSNNGGSQNFAAGQFGFTPSFSQPPVVLPSNPGMQFSPPPSFSSSAATPGPAGAGSSSTDCVVR